MASPGIISKTKAVEVSIHAVAPLSIVFPYEAKVAQFPAKNRNSKIKSLFLNIFIAKK